MSAHSRLEVEAVEFRSWAADGAVVRSARRLVQPDEGVRFAGPPVRERGQIRPVGLAVAMTHQRWPMEAPGSYPWARRPNPPALPQSRATLARRNTCCKRGISSVVPHCP